MGRTRTKMGLIKVMDEMALQGAGDALDISNYKTVIAELYTSDNASCTIQFAVSMQKEQPNFNSPPSATNVYTFVQMADLINDSSIAGASGLVLAGTDVVKTLELNTNFVKWFCPIITAYVAGKISIDVDAVNELS